jgi:cytosine/adenosine deaminase-related metal-dependent hydrolase
MGAELNILARNGVVVRFPGIAHSAVSNAMMASGLLAEKNGFITPGDMNLAVLVPRDGTDVADVLMMLTAMLEELAPQLHI